MFYATLSPHSPPCRIPKQRIRDVDPPNVDVYNNGNAPDGAAMVAIPMAMPVPMMGSMFDQGNNLHNPV
jgi:hypothetical protein